MYLQILSLVFLATAIVIGFLLKVNTGVIAIALSLILGRIAGISDASIIKDFNYSLFLMLMGVTLLFAMLRVNGTLDLLARKVLNICARRVFLVPIVLYLLSFLLSSIGPGGISVSSLMATITVMLAMQMGMNPIKTAPFAIFGALAGGLSPFAPTGIIGVNLSEQIGYGDIGYKVWLGSSAIMSLFCIVLYFAFGWHKTKLQHIKKEELPKFTKEQVISLAGVVLLVLLVLLFKFNIALSAFLVVFLISVAKAGDLAQAFKEVSWNTLLLVVGVGMLISQVIKLGGIDLLADGLSVLMNRVTAAPIMGLTAGVLSWFSSASGVVMPTMIPMVPNITATTGGTDAVSIIVAICTGGHMAAFSPMSTSGSFVFAAYSSIAGKDQVSINKMFGKQFIVSAIAVLFTTILLTVVFLFVGL